VALETEKTQLEQASQKLYEELQSEIALAGRQTEMAMFFGDFAQRIRNRQEQLAAEIQKVEQKIVAKREDISEAFSELKKYEIALDNAKARQKETLNRRENLMFDEIAEQQHRRKQTQEN
jgi:flagellar FliJ protein